MGAPSEGRLTLLRVDLALPRVNQLLIEAVRNRRHPVSAEYRSRHKDGSWRIVASAGINLLSHDTVHKAKVIVQKAPEAVTQRLRAGRRIHPRSVQDPP